jgi:hypothetical protein
VELQARLGLEEVVVVMVVELSYQGLEEAGEVYPPGIVMD